MRLGGTGAIHEYLATKPKGMHWRTYWRLRSEANDAELAMWHALLERMDEATARLNQPAKKPIYDRD